MKMSQINEVISICNHVEALVAMKKEILRTDTKYLRLSLDNNEGGFRDANIKVGVKHDDQSPLSQAKYSGFKEQLLILIESRIDHCDLILKNMNIERDI